MSLSGPGRCSVVLRYKRSAVSSSNRPVLHLSDSSAQSPWQTAALPSQSLFAAKQRANFWHICKCCEKSDWSLFSRLQQSTVFCVLWSFRIRIYCISPSSADPERSASAPTETSSAWWLLPGCFHSGPGTTLYGDIDFKRFYQWLRLVKRFWTTTKKKTATCTHHTSSTLKSFVVEIKVILQIFQHLHLLLHVLYRRSKASEWVRGCTP